MRSQTTRTIGGRVNGDGSSASGGPFSSRRTGTGAYALELASDVRLLALSVVSANANAIMPSFQINGPAASLVRLYNITGALQDQPWHFVAVVTA